MASLDESTTVATASSSGIQKSDVTVLAHKDLYQLAKKFETALEERYLKVAIPLAAGRPKVENLISCVRNAKVKIILVNTKTVESYQKTLDVLKPEELDFSSTLIFYEQGFKHELIRKSLRNIIRIKLNEDYNLNIDQIEMLIKLHKQNSKRKSSRKSSIRKQFVDLLLHFIIDPLAQSELAEIKIVECQARFAKQYGNFLYFKVGNLEKYVKERSGFKLSKNKIYQTTQGKKYAKQWFLPTNTSSFESETKLLQPSTSDETEARTGEWILQSGSDKKCKVQSNKYQDLLMKHLNEFDSRFAFFLISSRLPSADYLSGIANVPWLRVFDFDTESRESGLLSFIEHFVKKKRNITISTCHDTVQTLSERSTDWYFPLGFTDKPNTVDKQSPYLWYCDNKELLEQHGTDMADFCSCCFFPIILILWYNSSENATVCLDLFLSALLPHIKTKTLAGKIIICTEKLQDDRSTLHQLVLKYQLQNEVLEVPLSCICDWLSHADVPPTSQPDGCKLPRAAVTDYETSNVEISEELPWIQQFIDILPLQNLQTNTETFENIGEDFVKGGIATWQDLNHGIAVEREKQKSVYSRLLEDLKSDKKTIVSFKILHSPGGGGTTFARQLLWYLHTDVPCGVALPLPIFSVTQLLERIEFLYDKTQLPVVLLIDGRNDFEVEQLYENCKHSVVILHVQRCTNQEPRLEVNQDCILPGVVTSEESQKLAKVLSKFSPDKREDLQLLAAEPFYRETYLFEFGLTAFAYKFKGVQAYVKGYLNLENQGFNVLDNLAPWQNVIVYLSLVLYYAQGGLHKEVFHHILKTDLYNFVTFEDLGSSGQKFVVKANREWKINYYAVAMEILEQVLSCSSSHLPEKKKHPGELSKSAKVNLHKLVINFIRMLKCAMGNNNSDHIFQQLSNVILRRDYREMEMIDAFEKRHSFSRLLEDVPIEENRIKILKSLTQAFPNQHEFHAYLGRMYSFMGEHEEAEVSLEEALKLRISKRKDHGQQKWPDNVRGRLHNMFGYACRRRIWFELDLLKKHGSQSNLQKVMKIAKKAVFHFGQGRHYATNNRSYSYFGEIRVRLLISEYVHKSKDFPKGCLEAFNGVMDKKNLELSEFIRESLLVCDQLLSECNRYISESEYRDVKDTYRWIDSFITCYDNVDMQEVWTKNKLDIVSRRSQIASLKILNLSDCPKTSGRIPTIDNIESKENVEKAINCFEENFREVLSNNIYKDYSISVDVLEWLEAIRHDKIQSDYSLIEVLQIVEAWESRNEIGYATYYLYILNFLLALYTPGLKMRSDYHFKAIELKKKLRTLKQRQVNTRLTREWLAHHDPLTIRKLVCRSKLGTWNKETRFWEDSDAVKQLQVCTGIVTKSSHKLYGVIQLDLPYGNLNVEIIFYPSFYQLVGSRHADQSTPVEFFIGFSAERGAEALSIRKLQMKFCRHCNLNTKVLTLNQESDGVCATCKTPVNISC